MSDLPIVPGRGLNTSSAILKRQEYLKSLDLNLEEISEFQLDLNSIQRNIESFIGSVEIPLGLVGPILFKNELENKDELVYCPVGTLEGALVYSMNRGAKVISKSGGFSSKINHHRMMRAPLFLMESSAMAKQLVNWVNQHFKRIKEVAETYSNHANLLEIKAVQDESAAHLRFYYSTGDSAGQNMSTICTWHGILFIAKNFQAEFPNTEFEYVIEGNGASDKKISQYNIDHGRGHSVTACCEIPELVINDVLRTSSDQMIKFYNPSKRLAQNDGMIGYNINVANAIAAIFVATGQDLASIHESSSADLSLEKTEIGLKLELTLNNLVIGTVGGGTHLPKQSNALDIIGCRGKGKVERFASLISGLSLGLEISTFAAIVSGEFAKAHEKLGRNKPVNWLLKAEIVQEFIRAAVNSKLCPPIEKLEWIKLPGLDNGTLTQLTKKVSHKLIGYFPIRVNDSEHGLVLLKIKPLSTEVVEGLHRVASSIDRNLADLLYDFHALTEYNLTHEKEILVNQILAREDYPFYPKHFGDIQNKDREVYMLITEYVSPERMRLYNSENNPEYWFRDDIKRCIAAITTFHKLGTTKPINLPKQQPWNAAPLYERFMNILVESAENNKKDFDLDYLRKLNPQDLKQEFENIDLPCTMVHNDFNPRNIMVGKDGKPYIYDWELCMLDLPQRDVAELLCFVLSEETEPEELLSYIRYQFKLYQSQSWTEWLKAYQYAIKALIVSRFSFYEVSGIVERFEFSERVLKTSIHLLKTMDRIIQQNPALHENSNEGA